VALADFGPVLGSEVGARNGQERVECGPERAGRLAGAVRRLPQEPTRTRGNRRDQARKNPNRERLGFHYWWRRRESNPRPQALRRRIYMLIRIFVLTGCYPTGREDRQRVQYFFSASALDELPRDLVRSYARRLHARARLQSDGTLLGFKQRVRSCRRWQLYWLQVDLRGVLPLGMPLRFHDPRRNRDAPLRSLVERQSTGKPG
jgi:hypothetical protein